MEDLLGLAGRSLERSLMYSPPSFTLGKLQECIDVLSDEQKVAIINQTAKSIRKDEARRNIKVN